MKHSALPATSIVLLSAAVMAQKPAAPPASPAPAVPGLSAERLERFGPSMNQLLKDGRFAGISVTVARDGRIAYQREFGFADLETKTPLKPDTIYRVYSMSKPITGFTMSVTADVAASTGYGSVGDFGWDGAASTFFRVDPKERLIVLVMTQRMPTDLEVQVRAKALAYQALTEK